ESKQKLFEEVKDHNADGALAIRMGDHIVPFLKGESDPLEVMFSDDLLDRVYDEAVGLGDIPSLLNEYLNLVYHNSTNLRILEVGAGTGSSTAMILSKLNPLDEKQRPSDKRSRVIQ